MGRLKEETNSGLFSNGNKKVVARKVITLSPLMRKGLEITGGGE